MLRFFTLLPCQTTIRNSYLSATRLVEFWPQKKNPFMPCYSLVLKKIQLLSWNEIHFQNWFYISYNFRLSNRFSRAMWTLKLVENNHCGIVINHIQHITYWKTRKMLTTLRQAYPTNQNNQKQSICKLRWPISRTLNQLDWLAAHQTKPFMSLTVVTTPKDALSSTESHFG